MGGRLARVAGISTAVVLILYVTVLLAIDLTLYRAVTSDADARISGRLAALKSDPRAIRGPDEASPGSQPIYWWLYGTDGSLVASMRGAPRFPAGLHPAAPVELDLGSHHYRITGVQAVDIRGQAAGWLVVGTNVDDVRGGIINIAGIEAVLAIPLAALSFLGALWIARRSVAPVEEARRRQLAFTADASHELRTPLTVIEAEASLALQKDRDAASYRASIQRIAGEGARLRRIVEDLLWLARFESEPSRPEVTTVDLGAIAAESVSRFQHVADGQGIRLSGKVTTLQQPLITAPAEWIDRLAGVLIDNACRYSPQGAGVEVSVVTGDGRVRLAVDDSGPGIPAEERARIFDRFHRVSLKPGGAGLGLAIGDAVVKATGGRWEVGASAAGGARMAVSWPLGRGNREPDLTPEERGGPAAGRDDQAGGEEAVGEADGDGSKDARRVAVLGDDPGVVGRLDRTVRG